MIKAEPVEGTPHDREADPAKVQEYAKVQEHVRERIRAELAKHDPIDDARRPLELIIETSLRTTAKNGEVQIHVVDADGRPRMLEGDGQVSAFTMSDLIEELRLRHPALFKPASETAAPSLPDPTQDGPRPEQAFEPRLPLATHTPARPMTPSRQEHAVASGDDVPLGMPPRAPESLDRARNVLEDMRDDHPRPWLLLAGAAALVLLLGTGAFLAWQNFPFTAGEDETVALGSPPAVEPVTTGAVAGQERVPAAEPTPSVLRGAAEAIDTATLRMQGRIVRLFGVEWAKGGGKPEDLTTYLNGREVTCEPAAGTDVYRCRVGGQDLSKVVLFNGGGRATAQATDELKAAENRARTAKLGVWTP